MSDTLTATAGWSRRQWFRAARATATIAATSPTGPAHVGVPTHVGQRRGRYLPRVRAGAGVAVDAGAGGSSCHHHCAPSAFWRGYVSSRVTASYSRPFFITCAIRAVFLMSSSGLASSTSELADLERPELLPDLRWLDAACRRRGLHLRRLGRERDGQTWLLISRDPRRRLRFSSVWIDSPWSTLRRRELRRLR